MAQNTEQAEPETGEDQTQAAAEPDASEGTDDDQGRGEGGKQTEAAAENPEMARLRTALAKANKDAERNRTRLKEFEDRDKTEVQRAQEAHAEATRRASDAEAKLTRFQVAAEKGLDAELVDFLPTGSREDMEAAADTLLGKLAAAREPRRPKPDPSQGTGGQPSDSSMNTLIRSGLGR